MEILMMLFASVAITAYLSFGYKHFWGTMTAYPHSDKFIVGVYSFFWPIPYAFALVKIIRTKKFDGDYDI